MIRTLLGSWLDAVDEAACAARTRAIAGLASNVSEPRFDATHPSQAREAIGVTPAGNCDE